MDYDYCKCKEINPVTTGFEDEWGYWDVCTKCGKRIENGHHYIFQSSIVDPFF